MSVAVGDRVADQGDRPIALAQWTVVNVPATAAQAIAIKAAGSGQTKHVCTGIVARISCAATAQTPIFIQVLDGASVVFSTTVAAVAGASDGVTLTGLWIEGSPATSMTLQFSAAGVLASQETVTLIGVDVV